MQEGWDSYFSYQGSLGWVFPEPEFKTEVIVEQVQLVYADTVEEAQALSRASHKEGVQTFYGKTAHNINMDKTRPFFVLIEPFVVVARQKKQQRPKAKWPRKPKM